MLALEVEYLLGRAFAATAENKTVIDWPPHPSKLFAALVAAYEECDLGDDARSALEWLEDLPAPQIYANPPILPEGGGMSAHKVFVPVNDPGIKDRKHLDQCLPERRMRQPLWFPSFAPSDPRVWFIWSGDQKQHGSALQHIAENVTYLGHSMSPVRVRVSDSPPEPTLTPDPAGQITLRVPEKGRLRHLEAVFNRRRTNTTIQPHRGLRMNYRVMGKPREQTPASLFRRVYVFRLMQGSHFPPENAANLVSTVRQAILALYPEPIPEIISGHNPQGGACKSPHLAITPLLDAGHRYADGHAMGFALWLPQDVSLEVIDYLETALSKLDTLTMGRQGRWDVQYVSPAMAARMAKGLDSNAYVQDSATWASVTPVVFGKHPKKSHVGPGKDGGQVFAELCDWIGLPKPAEVRLGPVSAFNGVPNASEFKLPDRFANRFRAHVWLRFPEPVRGPVLIGAGQFSGFGLCKPWRQP